MRPPCYSGGLPPLHSHSLPGDASVVDIGGFSRSPHPPSSHLTASPQLSAPATFENHVHKHWTPFMSHAQTIWTLDSTSAAFRSHASTLAWSPSVSRRPILLLATHSPLAIGQHSTMLLPSPSLPIISIHTSEIPYCWPPNPYWRTLHHATASPLSTSHLHTCPRDTILLATYSPLANTPPCYCLTHLCLSSLHMPSRYHLVT